MDYLIHSSLGDQFWDEQVLFALLKEGDRTAAKLAREMTPPVPWQKNDLSAMDLSASLGDLDTLRWLQREGCPFTPETLCAAAAYGRLEVMKWLRTQGCPWGRLCGSMASKRGDLLILRWIFLEADPPCPKRAGICWEAVKAGHWDLVRWLRTSLNPPCPWVPETEEQARDYFGDEEVDAWN